MDYRRVIVTRSGGPEVLQLLSEQVPEPAPGQVRVRVHAAGVSYGDVLARSGAVPDAPKPPFTPGFDITGVVDALGEDVASPAVGQRVTALLGKGGGYAEFVSVSADRLVAVPDGVDSFQSAATVLNYFVAYQMLHRVARLRAGQSVLVHGAAGGVGSALLQLGTRAGLTCYGTASKPKHQLVRDQGAVPIDYQNEDFLAQTRGRTGDGVDAVFDPIGGLNFLRSHRCLRAGGHLVAYGTSRAVKDGRRNRLTAIASYLFVKLLAVAPTGRAATFYTAGSLEKSLPDSYRDDLATVLKLLADKEIEPLHHERIPLADASVAHDRLSRSTAGKIVLTCAEG